MVGYNITMPQVKSIIYNIENGMLIRVCKNISKYILLFIITSCSIFKNNQQEKNEMTIYFGSIYNNEEATISVNDSIYFTKRILKIDSWGIDPINFIKVESDSIRIKGIFNSKIDESSIRNIVVDTILYKKRGSKVIIGLNFSEYYITQLNNKFVLE